MKKTHLQEASKTIEPLTVKYKAGLLVDNKFSSVLSSIFGHKTGDNHQRSDLRKSMDKFTAAHKAFQAEYAEIAKKHAKLDENGKPVYENGELSVPEENSKAFNEDCDLLFNRDQEMTFENGRKPFNAMTLSGISLSAGDTIILGDFYTEGF